MLSIRRIRFHRHPYLRWMIAVWNHLGHDSNDRADLAVECERFTDCGRIALQFLAPEGLPESADRCSSFLMIGWHEAAAKNRLHSVHAEIAFSNQSNI